MSILGQRVAVAESPPQTRRSYRFDPSHAPALDVAIDRARSQLLSLQKADGHWVGELQGDTILESEYILLMAFLGREDEDRPRKAGNYILTQMRADGGWANYPHGPADLSVTIKAYFALKLTGHSIDEPYMVRAREIIHALGGATRCNSFTKFYLALLGQFPYDNCATVPPEMVFLPSWAYFSLYSMSSWTRTIVVPLSIFSACRPLRKLPDAKSIPELFNGSQHKYLYPHPPTRRLLTATNFFLAVDQLLKMWDKWGPSWVRRKAVEKASAWMCEHFTDSDGVGAIFPPIIYTIISLRAMKFADDSPEMVYALKQLEDLMIEEGDTLRVQPCFSPVWDTALALNALAMSNTGGAETAQAAASRWLIEREVRRPGDWSLMNPGLEPAGWYFEYRNGFYPDVDDTAMVLMGLARSGQAYDATAALEGNLWKKWHNGAGGASLPPRIPAVERGLRWLLGMQNKDGGWAAFDRDINREWLTKIPFADHNAMLDPSCPDITARVLEALGQFGFQVGHPQVDRGLKFIEDSQDSRGCWLGRWGVNYLYGTWQVLQGLEAINFDNRHPMVQSAIKWLKKVQQPSGGWGESCASYDDPKLAGQGAVTASQTAWALLGLIAAGEAQSAAVRRGVEYLQSAQQHDGNWHEDEFTGTGFPRVFYLKYHLYCLYFPLMALARYRRLTSSAQSSFAGPNVRVAFSRTSPQRH